MHVASPSEQIKTRQFAQTSAVTVALSFVLIGSFVFLALNESAANENNAYVIEGLVAEAPKTTGEAWAVGAKLYWDASESKFTTTATDNTLCGRVAAPAISAATTGSVDFNTYAA